VAVVRGHGSWPWFVAVVRVSRTTGEMVRETRTMAGL